MTVWRWFALALCALVLSCSGKSGDEIRPNAVAAIAGAINEDDCPAGYNIIIGTNGADVLNGTNDDDCILGRGGSDVINGNGGNDYIAGGGGNDDIDGGGGGDTIFGEGGRDTIRGRLGDDVIDGGSGKDDIRGDGGQDIIYGGGGNDTIHGGDGADFILGGSGKDDIDGGGGDDVIDGEGGNDHIDGGSGKDVIQGGTYNDTIIGGNGDDVIDGGKGKDNCDGKGGNDIIVSNDPKDLLINGGQGNADVCDGINCENPASLIVLCTGDGDCPSGSECTYVGVCNKPGTGGCVNNGECDDGNACTSNTCVAGDCVDAPVNCNDSNACTADSCNPATGCVNSAVSCDDSNECTADSCDAISGCSNTNLANGTPCDGGDGMCQSGSCVVDPCAGVDCDDADACTADSCSGGVCSNDAISCDDGNECTADSCDSLTGCDNTAVADGTPCGAGGVGTCESGVCSGGGGTPAAYRIGAFDFLEPAFILPFSGCGIDQTSLVQGLVNGAIGEDGDDPPDGLLDLSILLIQDNDTQTGNMGGVITGGDCTDADHCTPTAGAPAPVISITHPAGDCIFEAGAVVAAGSFGCFLTTEADFTLSLGSIQIPLEAAQSAGQYDGNPAAGLPIAHLSGFLDQVVANNTILPADLPLVGGLPLGDLLRDGDCGASDERVTGPSGLPGWQFEIDLVLDRVDTFTP